ncbi:MAG: NAD(P)-dependent oxidoreductase [Pseudomonadota bacterium]
MTGDPAAAGSSLPRIGWIGAGMMGSAMAARLMAAGHPLSVTANRSRARIDALLADGATEAAGPATLAAGVDILVTCVPDAPAVEAVAEAVLPALAPGALWIDVTTSLPEVSRRIAARLAGRGIAFADAPVTGGPPQAAEGTLAALIGCAEAVFPRVEATLAPCTKVVRRFGEPGSGHAAKLLNNLVSQGTMVLLADAYRAAAALGVDRAALYEVMMAGAARSGTLEKAVAPALAGNYDGARFSIANAAKDLAYARALLETAASVDPAVAAALADRLAARVGAGEGEAFVSTMLRPDA